MDEILPYKILLRGALHCSAPSFKLKGNETDALIDLNEALLNQDDVTTLGNYMPSFLKNGNNPKLYSLWVTTHGPFVVTCVLGEYMMRVYRLLVKVLLRFSEVTAEECLTHIKFMSELIDGNPSVNSTPVNILSLDVKNMSPDEIFQNEFTIELFELFLNFYQDYKKIEPIDYQTTLQASKITLNDFKKKIEKLEIFWGFDDYQMDYLKMEHFVPFTMVKNFKLQPFFKIETEQDLKDLIYPRYAETLRSLSDKCTSQTSKEQKTISKEMIVYYMKELEKHEVVLHECKSIPMTLKNRNLSADIITSYNLKTKSFCSFYYMKLIFSLGFIMFNL